jgi:hypothetical protein
MLRKKLLLLLMLLTLLVSVSTPESARACSGDDCGCGYEAQQCVADCDYEPPEYQFICKRGCARASVQCAKACCSPY